MPDNAYLNELLARGAFALRVSTNRERCSRDCDSPQIVEGEPYYEELDTGEFYCHACACSEAENRAEAAWYYGQFPSQTVP